MGFIIQLITGGHHPVSSTNYNSQFWLVNPPISVENKLPGSLRPRWEQDAGCRCGKVRVAAWRRAGGHRIPTVGWDRRLAEIPNFSKLCHWAMTHLSQLDRDFPGSHIFAAEIFKLECEVSKGQGKKWWQPKGTCHENSQVE